MVKMEHKYEYNKMQEQERLKSKWSYKIKQFITSRWTLGIFSLLCLLVPGFIYLLNPQLLDFSGLCNINSNFLILETKEHFPLVVDKKDVNVLQRLQKGKPLYHYTTKVMQRILNPGDIAIDIGAGFGLHTITMAHAVGEHGKVYSFPHDSSLVQLINASTILNRLDNVHVHPAVFTAHGGNIILQTFPGYMEFYRLLYYSNSTSSDTLKFVQSYTLDEMLPDIKNVSLIRINVMGAEPTVLRGAQRIITSSPRLSILIDWYYDLISEYVELSTFVTEMLDTGFEFWAIDNENDMHLLTFDALESYSGPILITRAYF